MPKTKLMEEEKKGTPSTNTIASASAKGVTQNTAKQISAKAQAVADKYGTQDSRYDMGNPEFAKTVNSYRDQQKQKTVNKLLNYREKVLDGVAETDGDRFEYAGKLADQIAKLQSENAREIDYQETESFLKGKMDSKKWEGFSPVNNIAGKNYADIDKYIEDITAIENDLKYGQYTDDIGEEKTNEYLSEVHKNLETAYKYRGAREALDAWEVGDYNPGDVLEKTADGYGWKNYDKISNDIDNQIVALQSQWDTVDEAKKASIHEQINELYRQKDEISGLKDYQDKLATQLALDDYAKTGDLESFSQMASMVESRDDSFIERSLKTNLSAMVGIINIPLNIIEGARDYLGRIGKQWSDMNNVSVDLPEGSVVSGSVWDTYNRIKNAVPNIDDENLFDVNDPKNLSTKLRDYANKLSLESMYGTNDVEKVLLEVQHSTVNQLIRLPLGQVGSLLTMALQTGGEAYREEIAEGYSPSTAMASAFLNGVITYKVEQIGWQGLEKALNSGAMNYTVGQYIYSLLTNPISEGLEEGVEYIVDAWADELIHHEWLVDGKIDFNLLGQSIDDAVRNSTNTTELFNAVLLGYLGGFAMDTIASVPGFISTSKRYNAFQSLKTNIEDMRKNGTLTKEEDAYYSHIVDVIESGMQAFDDSSAVGKAVQKFSDSVPNMTSVADAQNSLAEGMAPTAEKEAVKQIRELQGLKESFEFLQQLQEQFLQDNLNISIEEFSKLTPVQRADLLVKNEYIKATGSKSAFLLDLFVKGGINGQYSSNGILINPKSDEGILVTFFHEWMHKLEKSKTYKNIVSLLKEEAGGEENWNKLLEAKREDYYTKLKARHDQGIAEFINAYKEWDLSSKNWKALAESEVVAEQFSKGRDTEQLIKNIGKYNKSLLYRLYTDITTNNKSDVAQRIAVEFMNAMRDNLSEDGTYNATDAEEHKNRAVEEFGTTEDFTKAGYILNDGRMLDMSEQDRTALARVFERDNVAGLQYLMDFFNEGNIRINAEAKTIEVSSENIPTVEQANKIRQFAEQNGDVRVNILDAEGGIVASLAYTPDTAQDVINDLSDFYEDGTIPENDTANNGMFTARDNNGNPDYSLGTAFQAVGMSIVKTDGFIKAYVDGKEVKKITADMIDKTPLGNMLRLSANVGKITEDEVKNQKAMFATLLNTVLDTKDPDLVWAITGSLGFQQAPEGVFFDETAPTAHSAFTSNSDKQYGTTFDVTTICTKTQQLIDVASRVMVELKRGLTEEEIINIVYDEVNKTKDDTGANQPVPCPVCYVFSRWVGAGKLLDSIYKFQNEYANTDVNELRARYNELDKQVSAMAKERGVKGTKARDLVAEEIKEEYDKLSSYKAQISLFGRTLNEEQEARLASLEADMKILDRWSWIGKTRLASNYKPVPPEILFDLNKGEQFANEYPATWKYRTTRGPGMGKAITPYSSQVIGQTIYGVAGSSANLKTLGKRRSAKRKQKNGKEVTSNVFLTDDIAQARSKLRTAIDKANAQNLLGGSRAQSTSDFRFEYVFDYILHFMDLQAMGSKGQTYTKVPEAVPMLASVGYEVNCSLMPFAKGVREVTEGSPNAVQLNDGRWVVLNCSTVTGMHIEDALRFAQEYDNVQPIMVGLNDDHIFACMRDDRITFIIPYHASGGSQERYEAMMSEIGEVIRKDDRKDYSKIQNDSPLENATPEQKRRRELRTMILTGKISGATKADMELIHNSKYLSDLYKRFYVKGVDPDCYGVKLSPSQAEQIYPFEYWDKTTTFETADENGRRFWEYCAELGMKPRFEKFGGKDGGEHGYWKMLIDRRMYNNDGTYHVQQAINMSNFKTDFLERQHMVKGLVQPSKEYKKVAEFGGEKVVLADYIGNKVIDRINKKQFSLSSKIDSTGKKLTPSQMNYFKNTKVVDAEGNLQVTYHGTPNAGFTEYDSNRLGSTTGALDSRLGFHFTDNKDLADLFTEKTYDVIYEEELQKVYEENNVSEDSVLSPKMRAELREEAERRAEERALENERGEIKEQYLNITKPLDLSNLSNLTAEERETLVGDLNYIATGDRDAIIDDTDIVDDLRYGLENEMGQFKDEISNPESIARMKELGYDGMIMPIQKTDADMLARLGLNTKGKEYITFDSNQAKNTDNLNPTGNKDIRYSLADVDFADAIRLVKSGEFKKKYGNNAHAIVTLNTPKILLQYVPGLKNLPITMDVNHIDTATFGFVPGMHQHYILEDVLAELPNAIERPIVIFEHKFQKSINLIVPLEDYNQHKVLVALRPNTYVDSANGTDTEGYQLVIEKDFANNIASAFGLGDNGLSISDYVDKYVKRIMYPKGITKQKMKSLVHGQRIHGAPSSNNNIPYSAKNTSTIQSSESFAIENAEYDDAIKNGDIDTARRLVEKRAKETGFNNAVPEQALSYKVRTGKAPQKTRKVYKVFTVDSQGRPSALFVSGVDALPQNVWLDAQDAWHFLNTRNGRYYVPSTKNPNTKGGKTGTAIPLTEISSEDIAELESRGFISKNKDGEYPKYVTALAYRPGWHAGDLPFFPQGGMKIGNTNYDNIHRYNQVVFECEIAYDEDYTNTSINKDGKIVYHDRQEMPTDGGYEFATNPMTKAEDLGKWYISGSLKINRALTEDECNNILKAYGFKPQEWQAYQDGNTAEKSIGKLDLNKLGYTGEQYDSARKTLAPVTYGDNGKVIPLNERFNPEKNDIRYSLNDDFESQVPEEVQNQLDADSLAEVDAINKDAKKMARRQSILTKKQQESFEHISNYDKDLVPTGDKATLDEVESDIKDMIKNDRIKDIKKNGFVESDAEAWEQHNKEVDEEIKNITSHTTSVEDANDNLKGIARILDEKPKLKSETAKQTWRYYRDLFVKEFVDHGRAVYRLAKEVKDPLLYALYDYSQNVDNIVGRMFANKRVDLQTGEVIGKGFDEVFAPIRDSGLSREFQNYMYHKLNIDRMTLSDRFSTEFTDEDGKISFLTLPNKPVFNKVVSAKMSQEFCDRMEAEHPEFLEWAKDIYEYEDAELRMLVKSGRLSQEQMNMLKQRYPHYVPISREMGMKPFVTDEQVVSSNRAIKKATGGTANINPLEYAMQKHSRDVYSTILHNDLYQRIGQYYEMPVDAEFEQDTDYKIDTMGNEVQPAQGENPPTLIYYENGERYVIEIDQDLYEALLPRNFAPDLPFVNGISNLRRNLITGWNPVFMFTNGMKDFQDAQFNTKFSPVEFNSAYAQAWKEIVNNGKLYQMYLNLGGEYNSYFRNDNGKVEGKGVPILSKVIALNEKVEIAPRLAEFICSLKHDMSTAEAMYNASDITTNFKRGGRTAKWMNRNGFTFLNASIQGFDKQVRNITDAKDKEGWKGVAKYMAKLSIVNAIPLVILNGLVWDDDDEYAELSDYIKQNYYIIGKYGEGKFIRIPKGRIASFYQTVMENAVNNDERKSMWDNLMNDLVDDMESFMNNVAPNNPIDNNLLSPLIQAHTNTAWYGDDIVPTRLQDERPSEQYDDSTDALSRAIGQFSRKVAEETGSSLFELSPYKINYLLDQYTGMVGDIGLPMLTPRAENRIDNQILSGFANPLLDKFTTDSTLKNQRVTDFYAMKEELNKLASSSEATEEQILASKFMNSVSGEMSQLYKDKRAIQSDTSMPNSEKFDEARNIQEQIIELAKKGLTGYDQIDIRGENATVGDVEYKKSSGGDWAKTKTRDFSQYYSTYGLDEDKQSQFKSAMEMTSKKDENGKTIRNSEALATRKALEEMGEYENVLKYIEDNGLEYKDFDLNKTVVGYDESKFNDKYNAVYETQEASAEPKSTSYTPRRNASQNGSNDSEEDFFSTLLNIINAPVSTSRSGLSANVAQVFKEGRQRSKSIRSNRDDLRKAIAKAKRKYNL